MIYMTNGICFATEDSENFCSRMPRVDHRCFAAEDSEVVALRIVWFVDPGGAVVCAVEISSSFDSTQRR